MKRPRRTYRQGLIDRERGLRRAVRLTIQGIAKRYGLKPVRWQRYTCLMIADLSRRLVRLNPRLATRKETNGR